jgi:hypothetical protein
LSDTSTLLKLILSGQIRLVILKIDTGISDITAGSLKTEAGISPEALVCTF